MSYPVDSIAPRYEVSATDNQVDQTKVDTALRMIRPDMPINQSQLANFMRNPNLNQAERDQIIQTLARENGQQVRFFANDAVRSAAGDQASLETDQQTIADAVQQAYSDGAIDKDDLLHIADANGAGNGGQRFMAILQWGTSTREPNGVCEVLADELWARNGNSGMDRASAAMFFTSDPSMMSRNLATPDARAQAFEALVSLSDKNPYSKLPDTPTATAWRDQALVAEGRLFTGYGQELVDRYTGVGADGTPMHTDVLAKFMSQTVLNPDAKGLWLDRSRDLVPAIRTTMNRAEQTFTDRAQQPGVSTQDQERAMQQLGRFTSAVSGATAMALTQYDAEINASQASKKDFTDMVSKIVGITPLGPIVGKIPLGEGDQLVQNLAGALYDALTQNPDRPSIAMARTLYDYGAAQAESLSNQVHSEDPRMAFDSAYSAELLNLQQSLNVNLGGHAS
ncbi:hypothetical protein [Dyella choica]|uniref:Uncharacterized protein n=1 Tax=Dyella choica TaxID=1927959 RepID=A0A432M6W3_9GAMM|nr:hypothetical protein [Dyella choica]RUL75946.1 hypothetical protein EKH80_09480 [Dyella choica]